MPDQATRTQPHPRRRLLLLALIALVLWIIGITLFVLTNRSAVPYLKYQLTSRVPLFATATPTAQPTATPAPAPTLIPCTPTPTQPCAAPTATPTPGTPTGSIFPSFPPLNTTDMIGFVASVISIVGAIPPTARFFVHASRLVRRTRRPPMAT